MQSELLIQARRSQINGGHDTTQDNDGDGIMHRYRAVFISDVHLLATKAQVERLVLFMNRLDTDKIYINGDLIDFWSYRIRRLNQLGRLMNGADSLKAEQTHQDFIQKLFRLTRKGTEVIYIPGNHDEVVRRLLKKSQPGLGLLITPEDDVPNATIKRYMDAKKSGDLPTGLNEEQVEAIERQIGSTFQWGHITVAPFAKHKTLTGANILLMHGDEFDFVHRHSSILVPIWKALGILGTQFRDAALSLTTRLSRLEGYVRPFGVMGTFSAAKEIERRIADGMKDDYATYAREYVDNLNRHIIDQSKTDPDYAAEPLISFMMQGHTHNPLITDDYKNTGDFMRTEHCTLIVEGDDGIFKMLRIDEKGMPQETEEFGKPVVPQPLRRDEFLKRQTQKGLSNHAA